jgi:NADH-quinone oxidoreductase subunit J
MSASVAVASGPLMTGDVPLGEAIAFWILGPLSLAGGIGMVLFRNAVHSALSLAGTMICLGAMYIVEQGPFIGLVQVIVYTGAIMILFLFVLMLVGRDSSDSLVEVLRGQRWAALLGGIALLCWWRSPRTGSPTRRRRTCRRPTAAVPTSTRSLR